MGKEIVTLGKELKMIKKALDERDCRMAEAYDWAVQYQREYGLPAGLLELVFDHGDCLDYEEDCIVSVFYNPFTGGAILRQDWPMMHAVHYDVLVNFDEIAKTAPRSLRKMIENGLMLSAGELPELSDDY